jgi:hypothetical protein
VVSEQAFSAWIEDAKKKFAGNEALPSTAVASTQRLPQ